MKPPSGLSPTFLGITSRLRSRVWWAAILRRRGSVDSLFPKMVFDLSTSRTGSLQIFLGVAFYFRLSMIAALQFVAQRFQTQSQLGSVVGAIGLDRNWQFT